MIRWFVGCLLSGTWVASAVYLWWLRRWQQSTDWEDVW